ncbi:hypothetical protein [Pyrolobus fumarii]|uniref:hypothetical protein n=1 Tax=Pyrolobus fumarii TaxID=54252 RepID=UPI0014333C72|nr:hypothetical protein [Pyrolobus fumarii]
MSWRELLPRLNEGDEILERLRLEFVDEYFGSKLAEAYEWVRVLKEVAERASRTVGAEGVLWTKELKSFLADPRRHLAKKLYIYALDLQRSKLKPEEFEKVALAAARTSLNTNMRSIYQAWVFLVVVETLGRNNRAKIVFPEHGHILLERSGRQRGGTIPPNLVLLLEGRGYLSFFIEAPRPIGWGDNADLAKAWRLYVALRPDMMVYSGKVLNMVEAGRNPPIRRPNVIIECKELPDWYARVREIRGPFARPMSGVEWRNRWLRGLWAGLADVLGVETPEKAYQAVKERRGLRLSEPQIVKLYARIYKPDKLYLVSRAKVPQRIRENLEDKQIVVIDGVGFDPRGLEELANELAKMASYGSSGETIEVDGETATMLARLASALGLESVAQVVKLLARYGMTRLEELRRLAGSSV